MSTSLKNVKLWLHLWCDCLHGKKKKKVLAAAQWQMRWWRCLHICHRHAAVPGKQMLTVRSDPQMFCFAHRNHTDCVWYLACKNGKYYYWNKCLVVVILQSDAENLGYLVFSQKLCCSHVGQASWNSSTSTGWVSLAFPTDTNVLKQQSLMALINRLIFWGWHTHVLVLIAVKIDADVPVPLKIVQFWFGNRSNFLFVL